MAKKNKNKKPDKPKPTEHKGLVRVKMDRSLYIRTDGKRLPVVVPKDDIVRVSHEEAKHHKPDIEVLKAGPTTKEMEAKEMEKNDKKLKVITSKDLATK